MGDVVSEAHHLGDELGPLRETQIVVVRPTDDDEALGAADAVVLVGMVNTFVAW